MTKVNLKTERGITTITSEIGISSPKEKVWDALKAIGEIEKFHPLVKKSNCTTSIEGGLGAKRHCELLPMGQMEEEVTEWKEGKSFTLEVIGGKMLPPYRFMKGKIDLEEVGGKTRVTFSFSYQLKYGILGRFIDIVMIRPQFKKAPPQYVSGLKKYVEKNNL